MHEYIALVPRSTAEQLLAAYERGAKDRLFDRARRPIPDSFPVEALPRDQLSSYADGWLDAFKAELRQTPAKGVARHAS